MVNVSPGYVAEPSIRPVDASGQPDYTPVPAPTLFSDNFTPTYRLFMPEYYLEGIQTETSMRDLSPIQESIYGTPHGANTHPPGGRAGDVDHRGQPGCDTGDGEWDAGGGCAGVPG